MALLQLWPEPREVVGLCTLQLARGQIFRAGLERPSPAQPRGSSGPLDPTADRACDCGFERDRILQ